MFDNEAKAIELFSKSILLGSDDKQWFIKIFIDENDEATFCSSLHEFMKCAKYEPLLDYQT